MATLRQVFEPELNKQTESGISLRALAASLGTDASRLVPLAREGYLRLLRPTSTLTVESLVARPPDAALVWMRSWFQPAPAKPLFSAGDVAALLDVPVEEVLSLAAAHNLPVLNDPALGWLLSVWTARQLILKLLGMQEGSRLTRFDRQALLWFLLEDDPERAAQPPTYDEAIEQEFVRIAKLEDEAARATRTNALLETLHDIEALEKSVCKRRG